MRIVLCLIALLCTAAAAQAQNAPTLVVQVIDCAQVPVSTMRVAEHAVTQAFRSAGVRALWREGSERAMPLPGRHVTVVILSKDMSQRKTMRDATPVNALGTAAPEARRAWVFLDRIQDVAALQQASPGTLLGIVIAHEVAHAAAGITHSQGGIMEPQLRLVGGPVRGFNAGEGQQLKHALAGVSVDAR